MHLVKVDVVSVKALERVLYSRMTTGGSAPLVRVSSPHGHEELVASTTSSRPPGEGLADDPLGLAR